MTVTTVTIMDGLTAIIFIFIDGVSIMEKRKNLLIFIGTLTCLVFCTALIVSMSKLPSIVTNQAESQTETTSGGLTESQPETEFNTALPTETNISALSGKKRNQATSETETGFTEDFQTETGLPQETETIPFPSEPVEYEALLPFLEADKKTIADIPYTKQMIIVQSSGTNAEVYLFEQNSGEWEQVLETSGVVGKNGVSAESREGDYRTPKGIFELGFAFGTESLKRLSIEYRKLNSNCYWVDDPQSEYYNQWVESEVISWNSAEHLLDYPKAYHYAVVVNYNMNPVVPYAGSAIFLHCWTADYTAGCIAVSTSDMVEILNWLDSSKNPVIWIF